MQLAAFFLVLLPLTACGDESPKSVSISDEVTDFSINLMQTVLKESTGNIILSPLSVFVLLAILHQGADGNTKAQLTHTLKAEPEQTRDFYKQIITTLQGISNGTSLECANGVFLNEGYEVFPEFKNVLVDDFRSEITTVKFTENTDAAQKINNWVSEHTHNKIKELVSADSLSDLTRMVLVNGIYFKDLWQIPFDPERTKVETFYSDTEKQVPMMHIRGKFRTDFLPNIEARVLEMPFQGEKFSMLIVLPQERNGLYSMIEKFKGEHIKHFLPNKKRYTTEVAVSMPKFELSTDMKLIPIIEKLGITDPFNIKADFSKISSESISVSALLQKAHISVDELGGTATAATEGTGETYALHLPTHVEEFEANHPFLALIMDDNNNIWFGGAVIDPSDS